MRATFEQRVLRVVSRIPVGRVATYRHYRNLHRTESRFRRLLRTFRFGTIGQILDGATLPPYSFGRPELAGERSRADLEDPKAPHSMAPRAQS